MDLGFTGRRVLVVGASAGIGFATAELLACEGAQLLIASRDAAGIASLGAAWFVPQGPRGLLLALGALGLTLGLVLWMRRRDYRASQREYDTRALDD